MSAPDDPHNPQREPIFTLPSIVMGLAILLFVIELASSLVLDEAGQTQLALWFGYIPLRFVYPESIPGGWMPLVWTSVTHAFLHGGWEHVLLNIAWLVIFGTPVARRYGSVGFLVIFLVSSIAGALAFTLTGLTDLHVLVGASGGIAGLTGAAVRFMFQPMRVAIDPETGERVLLGQKLANFSEMMANKTTRFFTIVWVGLNGVAPLLPLFFGGMDVQIAWEAHLGGFFAGLVLVGVIERMSGGRFNPLPQ